MAVSRSTGTCSNCSPPVPDWSSNQPVDVHLDVDVHHGDGVEAAFYDPDQVLSISLHQHGQTLFPGTGFPEEMGQGPGRGAFFGAEVLSPEKHRVLSPQPLERRSRSG